MGYVLCFLAKLCRSLLCDDLFSHQPFPRGTGTPKDTPETQEGRIESGKLCLYFVQGLQVVPDVPVLPGQVTLPLRGLPGALPLEVHRLPSGFPRIVMPAKTKYTRMAPSQAELTRDGSSY